MINPKCGFHVHIGNGIKKQSFPLSTVKNVLATCIAYVKQIDGLHARNRICGFDLDEAPHGLPEVPFPDAKVIDNQVFNLPLSMFYMAEANRRRRRDKKLYGRDQPNPNKAIEMASAERNHYPESYFSNTFVWDARHGNNVDAWLTLVRWAPDVQSLIRLYRGNSTNCNVNIGNLPQGSTDPFLDTRSGTI